MVNDEILTPIILRQRLAAIRQQIEDLQMASAAYAAIGITDEEYIISVMDSEKTITLKAKAKDTDKHQGIIDWLRQYTEQHRVKIVAAMILNGSETDKLGERLWLEEDIVPYPKKVRVKVTEDLVRQAADEVAAKFDANHLVEVPLGKENEVGISFLVTKDSYKKTVTSEIWDKLRAEVEKFSELKNKLLFINATPQGGGVALMRHALLRLLQLLDVNATWHALEPNKEVFEITKTKFHNVLQGVAEEGIEITEHDKKMYSSWIKENAEILHDTLSQAKVIVIDDPQPSGLVPHIKEINPRAKLIYRSHIHLDNELLDKEGTAQKKTWDFVWGRARAADVFVGHPIDKFIPKGIENKTVLMPATTDPMDGLNKPLNEKQMDYYLDLFNKILLEHDQSPLDLARPYVIQIARFDPSKGIPDVIEAYRLLREKMGHSVNAPQLVLVGHGSVDDPDGIPMYNMTVHLLQTPQYAHLADDVKVVRLHHNDQILNALLRSAWAALQLSHKEGFEVKVTEALHKGRPVVAYKTGGIPLQIEDEKTGFLVERGNCEAVADKLHKLMTDQALYEEMSKAAVQRLNPNYFTAHNALKWLELANWLSAGEKLS